MSPAPTTGMLDHCRDLDDPRVDRTKRHEVLDVVAIALGAVIGGADSWVEVDAFGHAKLPWLRTFLARPNGVPAHDTFGRVFAALDPAQFERGVRAWVQTVARPTAGEVVALAGQTPRRSHDRADGKDARPLVSAGATRHRLVLGQGAVDPASNELTAVPEVLRLLTLKGCLVTIDAMGCQPAVAARIVAHGADDVLALKENQPTPHQAVAPLVAAGRADGFATVAADTARTVEKGHGRIEVRRVWAVDDPEVIAYLNPTGAWAGLRSVAVVEAERRLGEQVERDTRHDVSSLAGEANRLGAAVRGQWGIENRPHWMLDIGFREDGSRVRRGDAAQTLAVLRRLALNLLR